MVFHWRLSDSKSPQVSRTLLRILAVLCNSVIWIVSTRLPTSKSSKPFNTPLVIVPKSTNHNWYNRHFHVPQLFQFSSKVEVLILFTFFQFYSVVSWDRLLLLLLLLLLLFSLIRAFHISLSRWFFTGVWVTASLLKSPEFVSGSWPFIAMLSFG